MSCPATRNRPQDTAESFVDGFWLSGDIGHMDEDGYLFVVDRKKDMIISGGFNVYPRMIEEAIYEHPDVEEAIVIGVPDAWRGQAAKAFVKLRAGAPALTLDALRAFLADKIGKHEMPVALELRSSLPRTKVGKLSKRDLIEEAREKSAHSRRRPDGPSLHARRDRISRGGPRLQAAALPAPIRQKMIERRHLVKEDLVTWQRILNAKGWAVPNWPAQWGGTGWTRSSSICFEDEMPQAPAPEPLPFDVSMVGPVIIAFGTEAQKKRFLPRIANLDNWWCQGFSEPGAGSDLAALKTTARRDGDDYVVNGQKIWTTQAQYADWMFAWCAPTRRQRSSRASPSC